MDSTSDIEDINLSDTCLPTCTYIGVGGYVGDHEHTYVTFNPPKPNEMMTPNVHTYDVKVEDFADKFSSEFRTLSHLSTHWVDLQPSYIHTGDIDKVNELIDKLAELNEFIGDNPWVEFCLCEVGTFLDVCTKLRNLGLKIHPKTSLVKAFKECTMNESLSEDTDFFEVWTEIDLVH